MTDFQRNARAAERAMREVFPETPLQRNAHLSERFEADIWLKREDLSPVRSYKIRGAFNAMRKQPDMKLFVCASAGNHGMAVAAGARIFGSKARIFLAKDVPAGFETRLRERQGAEVVRAGDTYEESVEAAKHNAQQTGAILLADGSWPGYVHPPSLVMEGYTAMAEELREHFEAAGQWPSHVFLQAGVGGIAGAITHMIRANWAVQPHIIIVEPDAAPCLLESHKAGKPVAVSGPSSNMGRLDCKEPSIIAHGIMQRCDVDFILVSDAEAAEAAAWLGRHGLATTPSGAAGLAGLVKHGACALPLVIVTEGAV
jgi:diaminopropionate ammonia-lyase